MTNLTSLNKRYIVEVEVHDPCEDIRERLFIDVYAGRKEEAYTKAADIMLFVTDHLVETIGAKDISDAE